MGTETDNINQLTDSVQGLTDVSGVATEVIGKLGVSFGDLSPNIFNAHNLMEKFKSAVVNFGKTDFDQSLLSSKNVMAGFTTALIGARDNFKDFETTLKSTGVQTFSSQWSDFTSTYLKSGGTIESIGNKISSMFANQIPDGMKGSAKSVVEWFENSVKSADRAVKMENVVLQLAAANGQLDKTYAAMGPNMENANNLATQQQLAMSNVAQATNFTIGEVEKYYVELGKIPGALEENVRASDKMIKSSGSMETQISKETATLLLARGANRSVSEVIKDMDTAYHNMGITGEGALRFTARMGEVAGNTGMRLEDIRGFLTAASDGFSIYTTAGENAARMTDGLASVTSKLGSALKETGTSNKDSIEILKNMTNQVNNLSIAQKAYVSAQTGGPGGLRGAFQIEQMLREGNYEEVFNKVKQTLTRQFGNIVSVEEASKSDTAAAQLVRQREMLKAGPLGGMVKDDAQASKLLEALKSGDTTAVKGLKDNVVQSTMDKGVMIQDQTRTILTDIKGILETAMAGSSGASLNVLQRFTAGQGYTQPADEQATREHADNLRKFASRAGFRAADTEMSENNLKSKDYQNKGLKEAGKGIIDIGLRIADSAVDLAHEAAGQWKELLQKFNSETGDKKSAIQTQMDDFKKRLSNTFGSKTEDVLQGKLSDDQIKASMSTLKQNTTAAVLGIPRSYSGEASLTPNQQMAESAARATKTAAEQKLSVEVKPIKVEGKVEVSLKERDGSTTTVSAPVSNHSPTGAVQEGK